jgi:hypothetical protein
MPGETASSWKDGIFLKVSSTYLVLWRRRLPCNEGSVLKDGQRLEDVQDYGGDIRTAS